MAIGQNAKETKDFSGAPKVLYTGVVPLKVLAVNPTKKQLETIYGREFEKEPEYISADENNVKKIRIDFIVQTVPNDKLGVTIEEIGKVSYFLEDKPRLSQGGKYQVINIYGETTWATQEEIKAGKLPENISFFPTKGMRPAFTGEEDLTNFVRTLLGISKRQIFNNETKSWVDIKNIVEAEGILEGIKKYFNGDISEITNALKSMPDNKIKLPAGVKITDDNKQYQAYATKYPITFSSSDKYTYYQKKLKETTDAGGYGNVDFGPEDLKFRLYKNTPTSFDSPAVEDDPFAAAMNSGIPANAVDLPAPDWFNQQ